MYGTLLIKELERRIRGLIFPVNSMQVLKIPDGCLGFLVPFYFLIIQSAFATASQCVEAMLHIQPLS